MLRSARAFWLAKPGEGEIRAVELPEPGPGDVVVRTLFSGISRAEKGRMVMLMVLITVSALFWGLYEQTYGPRVAMADRAMDRTTFGIEWTAGQTTAIGALAVIAMSPLFAWLWPRLDKLGLNPSYPAKFAWGLVFCGLSAWPR